MLQSLKSVVLWQEHELYWISFRGKLTAVSESNESFCSYPRLLECIFLEGLVQAHLSLDGLLD